MHSYASSSNPFSLFAAGQNPKAAVAAPSDFGAIYTYLAAPSSRTKTPSDFSPNSSRAPSPTETWSSKRSTASWSSRTKRSLLRTRSVVTTHLLHKRKCD